MEIPWASGGWWMEPRRGSRCDVSGTALAVADTQQRRERSFESPVDGSDSNLVSALGGSRNRGEAESGQQGIGALTDDCEGAIHLRRNRRRFDRSDVFYSPHFQPLPGRLDPVLAKDAVFRFHEHQEIARAHQCRRGPLPMRRRVGGQSECGQCVGGVGRDRRGSVQSSADAARKDLDFGAASGGAVCLGQTASVDVPGANEVNSRDRHLNRIASMGAWSMNSPPEGQKQAIKSPARGQAFLVSCFVSPSELLVKVARRARDVNPARNSALPVLHPLHNPRGLAALGAVGRLRCIHDLLAVACFCYLRHDPADSPSVICLRFTRIAARLRRLGCLSRASCHRRARPHPQHSVYMSSNLPACAATPLRPPPATGTRRHGTAGRCDQLGASSRAAARRGCCAAVLLLPCSAARRRRLERLDRLGHGGELGLGGRPERE